MTVTPLRAPAPAEVDASDVVLGWTELEEALPDYLMAQAYAEGEVDEVFASDGEIARRLAKASRAYRLPLIRVPVTARVNRSKVNKITADNDGATSFIEKCWDANDMDVWYPSLFWDTYMFGDAYVFVWPLDEEDEPRADSEAPADQELMDIGVELCVFDPLNVRMIYDPKNVRRKLFLIQRWRIEEEGGVVLYRADLWYADRVERWISVKDGDLSRVESWVPYEEEADGELAKPAVEPHEYGEIPWFHHRTGLPYGTPVHKNGYGAQNAITKLTATQLDTSDQQGWPQRYRLLDPEAELDANHDDPQWLDDEDAPVFGPSGVKASGGTNTSLRTGAGSIQTYPATKEVGQFEAADPEVLLGPAQIYVKLMATLTDTPSYLFYPEESPMGQAPSGVALERADAPLNSSVERLHTLQRGALREEWLFALKVAGKAAPGKRTALDIQWEPVARATSLEDWQVIGLKQQYGVPQEQTLTEAGYTQEQADEWAAEAEKRQQEMMDQLGQIAAADGKDPDAAKRKELGGQITGGGR